MSQRFDPQRTLLWGPNGAGKSAILKSLYRAFDAEPQGELPGWDYGAIVAVDFSVGSDQFTAVRRGDLRAMFRANQLVGAATSSSHWNNIFAAAVGFDLMLLDRAGVFRPASPSNFFLPFFVNQDGSFGSGWETFKSLKQFDKSVDHTLDYFARVRPPRYFELKAQAQKEKGHAAELTAEMSTLSRTRARLRRNLKATPVKVSAKEFHLEVKQLTDLSVDLAKKQDGLRKNIVEEQELAVALQEQIRLSNAALKEHSADFQFAGEVSATEHRFVCPTCHAEHDASFHTLLGLAEDARQLMELKTSLERDLDGVKLRLERHRRKASELREQYGQLQQLLTVKRGRFTFDDFIKSYSATEADAQLASEQRIVERELDVVAQRLSGIKVDLDVVNSEHDSKGPLQRFRSLFAEAAVQLDVTPPAGLDTWRLAKRPVESGSRSARSLVAYYSALWRTIGSGEGFPVPLVIDSPNQGAQDREHLKVLLAAVAATAPKEAQVILAHEEVPETFAAGLTVHLTNERRLLTKEGFDLVSAELFDFVQRARASLAGVEPELDDDGDAEDPSEG